MADPGTERDPSRACSALGPPAPAPITKIDTAEEQNIRKVKIRTNQHTFVQICWNILTAVHLVYATKQEHRSTGTCMTRWALRQKRNLTSHCVHGSGHINLHKATPQITITHSVCAVVLWGSLFQAKVHLESLQCHEHPSWLLSFCTFCAKSSSKAHSKSIHTCSFYMILFHLSRPRKTWQPVKSFNLFTHRLELVSGFFSGRRNNFSRRFLQLWNKTLKTPM